MNGPLIRCTDVAFSFEGRHAVCDLNFEINCGDYLCIVGPNGSGKSTLLKGLLGLKPASSGQIDYAKGPWRSRVGYLPQQSGQIRDFPANAWEVVLSGRAATRRFIPWYSATDKRIALEKLELLHLSDIRTSSMRELSGGQQQRVLLARALCAADVMLFCDEPTSGLDPQITQEFYALIAELNKSKGLTVVMVSHDVTAAVRDASTILHLQTHQLFFGPVKDYRTSGIGEGFIGCQHESGHTEQEHDHV